MINNWNSARENLVIVTTYKLILVTVLQSRKIGYAYVFVHRDLESNKITQLPEK